MHTKGRIFHYCSLALALMLGACSALPSLTMDIHTTIYSPLQIDLVLDKVLRLGKEVEITATIFTSMDLLDVSAEIYLPEGSKIVDGELTWRGDLAKDESAQIHARIAFTEEGNWTIFAIAQKHSNKALDVHPG